MAPKRKCVVSDEMIKEFPSFKRGRTANDVFCNLCNCYISIANKGKLDITEHISTTKHKKNIESTSGISNILQKFITSESDSKYIRAAEGTIAYHTIKHHQSFKSHDCSVALYKTLFKDSTICQKLACGRTKAEAIILKIFAPHTIEKTLQELEDIPYITVSTDASNHGSTKLFPILIQYFDFKNGGIQSKILNITNKQNETSDTISSMIVNELKETNLISKCVGFSGDNCNTNFGGVNRAGFENVFYKLKAQIKENIIGVGCPLHVGNNAAHCGLNQLSINVDGIVSALHNYFSIFTVRVAELQEFCEFVNIEYKTLLYHSKTRWLSLLPAVHRILEVFDGLKSYFLSIDKPPITLKNFFEDELTECYLWLVHSFMSMFQDNIKLMERKENSVIEIHKTLLNMLRCLQDRIDQKFVPLKIRTFLRISIENGLQNKVDQFKTEMENMYVEALQYIKIWTENFSQFDKLGYMDLTDIPQWTDVQNSLEFFESKDILIDDSKLFHQLQNLENFMKKEKEKSHWENLLSHQRWVAYFNQCKSSELYSELLKIAQYVFSIFAHNANVERVFSLITSQWTKERNKLKVETINGILQTIYNLNMDCKTFYNYLLNNPSLLSKIGNKDKY